MNGTYFFTMKIVKELKKNFMFFLSFMVNQITE